MRGGGPGSGPAGFLPLSARACDLVSALSESLPFLSFHFSTHPAPNRPVPPDLTDAPVRNRHGDIKAFRPSIMVGVPAVWEMIRKGIFGNVAGGGRVRGSVFRTAGEAKKQCRARL
ncbi:hypothetical protein K438DRAFT_1975175 [Mycena galopus ATCC 62051]|nr:hypothetical protein K438DRAFT_1975175 [Mycena galopus ATCC 62051]